jgi:hypothetical protein
LILARLSGLWPGTSESRVSIPLQPYPSPRVGSRPPHLSPPLIWNKIARTIRLFLVKVLRLPANFLERCIFTTAFDHEPGSGAGNGTRQR